MRKEFTIIFAAFLFSTIASAQEDTTSTPADTIIINQWVPAAIVGLNLSQIALSNWTQGGDNSLAWTFIATAGLDYPSVDWSLKNNLKFAYGRTKLGDDDYRTTDNDIYFETVYARKIGWAIDPYISNTIRTSVARGTSYDSIPPVEIANFFDPGYITQSIGFVYERSKEFNTRLGFAVQEVFTRNNNWYSDDVETAEIEKFKLETGLESVTTAEYILADNLLAKSLLRLFTRFESMDVWDVRWDNVIAAQINKYLNVNLTFLLVYEKAQSLRTQLKESLQLGITYSVF